jgi:NAD-dependent DNA ligase
MKNITKVFINSLKKDPYHVLSSLNDNEIAAVIQRANYEYYNAKDPLFSDQLYDIIKEYLEKRNPKHPILKAIGAAIGVDERKEELPYFLGSLDKIKTDDKVLNKWISSHPGYCVVSDKLDGNSALLHWKGCELKLYSRGDGSVGQNISHLLSFIKNIP